MSTWLVKASTRDAATDDAIITVNQEKCEESPQKPYDKTIISLIEWFGINKMFTWVKHGEHKTDLC